MFGELVREYRRASVLTQEELAARTGVSVRGIRKIETGVVAAPRPSTVRLLADAFNLAGEERERFCGSASRPTTGAAPGESTGCACGRST